MNFFQKIYIKKNQNEKLQKFFCLSEGSFSREKEWIFLIAKFSVSKYFSNISSSREKSFRSFFRSVIDIHDQCEQKICVSVVEVYVKWIFYIKSVMKWLYGWKKMKVKWKEVRGYRLLNQIVRKVDKEQRQWYAKQQYITQSPIHSLTFKIYYTSKEVSEHYLNISESQFKSFASQVTWVYTA